MKYNYASLHWGEISHNIEYSNAMTKAEPGHRFNIKMSSYLYRKSHCGDKTVLRSSYLHNGISYIGKTTSLNWIRNLGPTLNSQKTPYTTPSQATYEMSTVTIWGNTEHVIMALNCMEKYNDLITYVPFTLGAGWLDGTVIPRALGFDQCYWSCPWVGIA